MTIERVSGGTSVGAARVATRARVGGFSVPAEIPGGTGVSGGEAVTGALILGLQEQAPETTGDRPARRQGHALLHELGALQRELLTDAGAQRSTLERLARLADSLPQATTPELGEAIEAIRMRVIVEIARYDFVQR